MALLIKLGLTAACGGALFMELTQPDGSFLLAICWTFGVAVGAVALFVEGRDLLFGKPSEPSDS